MDKLLVSVIIPVFNEDKQIRRNVHLISEKLLISNVSYEIILIDDGSEDTTWNELKSIFIEMPGIRIIKLSRNFGKESALCAGLDSVKCDACIVMDADLQHPPDLIPEMIRLWNVEGYEVVECKKSSRGKENFIHSLGAKLFYHLLHRSSGFDLTDASDFKLMDKKVIESLQLMKERNTFFRGMSAWVGFKRVTLPFEVADRTVGVSKWSFSKLFKLAIVAITAFSTFPLQFVTMLGIMFLVGSILLGIQTLYMKFEGIAVSGFTTVILLLLIIGSTLMMSLGIIGTYIAKIYDEVKYRPRYLISESLENNETIDQ